MMIKADKRNIALNVLWALLVILIGFIIEFIQQKYFYTVRFHGDSAVMQVLAEAIKDEKSILPHDFYYGNQLILFRSSPFIALALSIGIFGYNAYIIGSSLSAALWFLLTYLILKNILHNKLEALVVSISLFIPLGLCDFDFMLGQQSHLANIVLSIISCFSAHRYIKNSKLSWLFISLLPVLLMSIESPIRAAILVLPLIITFLIFNNKKAWPIFPASCIIVTACGFSINKLLMSHYLPLGVDYLSTLKMSDTGTILNNLAFISNDILQNTSSMYYFAGHSIKSIGFIFYIASFASLLLLVSFFIYGVVLTSKYIYLFVNNNRPDVEYLQFALVLSVLGIVSGLAIIASVNPDSGRHILWALTLLKLTALINVYLWTKKIVGKRIIAQVAFLIGVLFVSCWVPILAYPNQLVDRNINLNKSLPINKEILKIMDSTGIHNIYGADFWRMMPLNSLGNNINSGVLSTDGENILTSNWLSRPSWFCISGDVLYYIKKEPTDSIIEKKLISANGSMLYKDESGSIWKSKPVWQQTTCDKK
ncbi:hypothetical protein [Citrobacter gillenii]|uniref:hypothetical protein n=1 Tax=Citrobacter gillenii TaxID=67828 RepID=UPI0022E61768|nr:hypothetical protein [Citrobacter gillenii]